VAQLTADDYKTIRRYLYRAGYGKEELKSLPALPTESTLLEIFQAAEDRTVAAFLLFKADLDSLLGVTTTTAAAKKVYAAYLAWKLAQ
jgi:hypothetical protein